jgi:hypothetical protein
MRNLAWLCALVGMFFVMPGGWAMEPKPGESVQAEFGRALTLAKGGTASLPGGLRARYAGSWHRHGTQGTRGYATMELSKNGEKAVLPFVITDERAEPLATIEWGGDLLTLLKHEYDRSVTLRIERKAER